MPHYKLTYFDTTGVAETIRFILSYGGQDFEDVRIKPIDWPRIKSTTPYGVVPTLEIDGKCYHQSLAISRYLAKQYNLSGSSDLESLEIDAIVDTINDFRAVFTLCLWEADGDKKAEKKKILEKEKIPFFLNKFETQLEENGGFFYGGKVTWADLMFVALLPYFNFALGRDILQDHQTLKDHEVKVLTIPNIKRWIEKRPTTCCLQDAIEIRKNMNFKDMSS